MYKNDFKQPEFEDFYLPFGGKLRSDNRWVILSKMIPWDQIEPIYAGKFSKSGMGAPAKSVRIALGALIIKERLGATDEETVELIRENPYLQYFLGYHEFREEPPFDPSMFVHFRKRFSVDEINQVNELILNNEKAKRVRKDDDSDDSDDKSNKGKLLVDATCTPADVSYPTDLKLLNQAREKSEKIIDILFSPLKGKLRKPRTYRNNARRDYLKLSKSKKPKYKKIRKAIRQQLGYLSRNLEHIEQLKAATPLSVLTKKQYKDLLVINELYRQQQLMFDKKTRRTNDRIVSISQPHVRPIKRGKVTAETEFGAKISASLSDGFVRLDRLSWGDISICCG